MKLGTRFAILALALAPISAYSAFADNSPQVVLATPGIADGAIERFTARFSQPMVALGHPRAASPFKVECPVAGEGRWVDQNTFVYEFKNPLPGGTTCTFETVEKLKSLAGYEVKGQTKFTVDSGGPVARAVLPSRYGNEIEEDQVFLVAANLAADRASVGANAYCAVEGLGEKIPVDVLGADVPAKLLGDLGTDSWAVRDFLSEAGLPETLPATAEDKAKSLASVTALRCRRPLPPGRDMALVWGKDIKSTNGRLAGADQRFDFTVRKAFTARFECSRVNPQAGCSPVQEAWVRFSAPVPRATAEAIRIETPDGKQLTPTFSDEDKRNAVISSVKFKAPLPAATAAKLIFPANVVDESGRKLANAERFPLDLRFDAPPPLVKFAATFGILELKEGGVLPVTVRAVEPGLAGTQVAIGGQRFKVDGSDGEVAEWLRKLNKAEEFDVEEIPQGKGKDGEDKEPIRINHTGDTSIFAGQKGGTAFKVNPAEGGKEFEVVGIPLTKPGFYVVELASPVLGEALLGRKAPRYVSAGALVTNMAVHFKWGRSSSLVWVSSLDSGHGVDKAEIRITDSCTGQLLAKGTTDASGRLAVPAGLPEPETYGSCEGGGSNPLMVSARQGDDYSFTLTSWSDGIKPFDFDLNYGWNDATEIFHTVFDRALVRQGETVHMKHIVRQPIATGFGATPAFKGTLHLSHRGSDTKFDVPLTIDANGIGETSWTAPQGAPMGDYDLTVEVGDRTIYTNQSFKVDEYKLPTMKASVAGPKDAAIRPTNLPLDLFVGYLSGGGASNLPVEMRIGYFPSATTPDGYDGYSFGGRAMVEGTKALNGNDEADADSDTNTLPPTQMLPVTLGGDGSARTTVDVPQGLDANTDMLVEMDYQDANGEVLTASRRIPIYSSAIQLGVKTDGWLMQQDDLRLRLVALDTSGKPVANQRVSVEVYSREILTARRRLIGGFYAYDNQMKTTKLSTTCSATTDSLGLAQCKLDPGVSGEVYVVATTTDANGNVARATRSVWLAGEDEWWFGGDNGDRMDVIPEQQEYKAGETAKFQVRMPFREATALVTVEREGVLSSFVVGLSGKDPVIEVPMPGDYAPDVFVSVLAVRGRVEGWSLWLSDLARDWGLPFFSKDAAKPTALVDLAKPAYRLGIAKVKVGWESHRLDVKVKADRERYAARDIAQVDVQVKNPDGSPAAEADVAFAAVDQALLQLAPNDSWDVLTAMMGERPISVLTSTAQMQVVGKRHYGKKAVEAGGGGGGDLSGLNRENFEPVLLWKGHVALDKDGRARVAVPMSDALSSFKLVAIATNGTQLFGTGEASVRTAQDLSIFAGLPPLVRTGDYFGAVFTLRNGSAKPMKVTATVDLSPKVATGKPLTVDIPAGGAVPVAWNLTAPNVEGKLRWKVSAKTSDGKAVDQITVGQDVVPAVPIEVWASALTRVGDSVVTITPPTGALPGRGSVDVRLTDTLVPPLQGVYDFMAAYPYTCFEQRLSRAIALHDTGAYTLLASEIPAYLDNDGLLRYFPSDQLQGSEALTAYVLSITGEAGLPLPEDSKAKMVAAMKSVLDGRLRHEDYGDPRLRRVAAFAALARQGAATAAMLGQLGIGAAEMPTGVLADYLAGLDRVQGLANGAQLRADGERVLRTRLVYEGTRIDMTDKEVAGPWWLMGSLDEAVMKVTLVTLGRPGWQDESPKMMRGLALRLEHGRWDTTTANAWGVLTAGKFNAIYPAEAIAGVTTASFGTATVTRQWPLAEEARGFSLPLAPQPAPLKLVQAGGAGPWAMVTVRAAVPLTKPLMAGYHAERRVTVLQAAKPGTLSRGDVVRVTISVDANVERNWVVINDPIPAGATIVGDLGGQSQMLAAQGDASGGGVDVTARDANGKLWEIQAGPQAAYVERRNDSWRGYFSWVPRGKLVVSYVLRLNASGHFSLPPTRVEAMYSPEIRAQLPNAPVTVAPR